MPTNRITMRQIRETLRLHLQARLSYGEVGRELKISKSAAGKYVLLARVAGVDWAVAQTLTDEELEARLFRPAVPRHSHQLAPDFALVHQELKRAGVTLQLRGRRSIWTNPTSRSEKSARGQTRYGLRPSLLSPRIPATAIDD